MDIYILILVGIIFGGSLIGIFATKTQGFGRYTTSILIIVLVLFVATISLMLSKIELQPFMNLLFAIAGFAGGLITLKSEEK